MKPLLMTLSFLALAASLVSSIICANQGLSADTNKLVLLVGMLVWFAVTPFWMRKHKP
ncbi:MAG: hypothetical protein NTW21_20700 [Verrucomicrobia bacterium]|nr:hypothetical protein [Verrucomicrobiota bacterium]